MRKEEIIEGLNEFFGFEVKWDKLSKEDLQKLYEFFNKPENVIRRLIDLMGTEEFIKTSNNVILHKIVDERPIRKLLKDWLFGRGGLDE